MYKQKNRLNDDKKIEVVNIYEDNGKKFEDILTETIKKHKDVQAMVIKYKKSNKGDF